MFKRFFKDILQTMVRIWNMHEMGLKGGNTLM